MGLTSYCQRNNCKPHSSWLPPSLANFRAIIKRFNTRLAPPNNITGITTMTTATAISASSSLKSPTVFLQHAPSLGSLKNWKKLKKIGNHEVIRSRRRKGLSCRSEVIQDAPFAAAIGACVLTSIISPISYSGPDGDEGGGGAVDTTDARFAVMGIISFIPYFNWMSWVFAWLDSGKQRYLVYAVVYLAPYLRTNLSLSPEESWLPIASIIMCIIHVQLEASIKNGDLIGIQFFGRALNLFSPLEEDDGAKFQPHQDIPKNGRNKKRDDLPSARNIRDGSGEWGNPRNLVGEEHRLKEYLDGDESEDK